MEKIVLRGIAAIVIFIVVSLGFVLVPKFYYMKSEYITVGIISETVGFVTEHPKTWPRSWQELGGEDFSRYTDFRFDLTPEMLMRDRQLIYSAIQPKCHRYRTYPYPDARKRLDELYEKLTSDQGRQ